MNWFLVLLSLAIGGAVGALLRLMGCLMTSGFHESREGALTETAVFGVVIGFVLLCGLLALFAASKLRKWLEKKISFLAHLCQVQNPPEVAAEPMQKPVIHLIAQCLTGFLIGGTAAWFLTGSGLEPTLKGENSIAASLTQWLARYLGMMVVGIVALVPLLVALRMAGGGIRDWLYAAIRNLIDAILQAEPLAPARQALLQSLENMRPILRTVSWFGKTAVLLGLLFGVVTILTGVIQLFVSVVQNQKLTEQNRLTRAATQTTIIDQQFREESATAEQAYIQIRDLLLRCTSETNPSSIEEQIFALKALPDAMRMRVTRAGEIISSGDVLDVEARIFFPNIQKLKPVLTQYLSMDRVGRALAQWHAPQGSRANPLKTDKGDRPLEESELQALMQLAPISAQIFLTLEELSATSASYMADKNPSQKNDEDSQENATRQQKDAPNRNVDQESHLPLCLWNLDCPNGFSAVEFDETYKALEWIHYGYKDSTDRSAIHHIDLTALPPGLFNKIQAPFLRSEFGEFKVQFPPGVDLSYAHLEGSLLNGFIMSRANLIFAHLEYAELEGAQLDHANLSFAKLKGANLDETNLAESILSNIEMIDEESIRGASLNGADLSNSKFCGGDFGGSSLMMAKLVGSDLSYANLRGVDLSNAQLQGANLDSAKLEGAALPWANLDTSILIKAHLGSVDFSYANLVGANLSGAHLENAIFASADLSGADFSHAQLDGAIFSPYINHGFLFNATKMFGTNFTNAKLSAADLRYVRIDGANFSGVNFAGSRTAYFTFERMSKNSGEVILQRRDSSSNQPQNVNGIALAIPGAFVAPWQVVSEIVKIGYIQKTRDEILNQIENWRMFSDRPLPSTDTTTIADKYYPEIASFVSDRVSAFNDDDRDFDDVPWLPPTPPEEYNGTSSEWSELFFNFMRRIFGPTFKTRNFSLDFSDSHWLSSPPHISMIPDFSAFVVPREKCPLFHRFEDVRDHITGSFNSGELLALEDILALPRENLDDGTRGQLLKLSSQGFDLFPWSLLDYYDWWQEGGLAGAVRRSVESQ